MVRTVDPDVLEDAVLVHRERARSLGDATRMMEGKTKEAAEARREPMRGFYRGRWALGTRVLPHGPRSRLRGSINELVPDWLPGPPARREPLKQCGAGDSLLVGLSPR